MKKYLITGGGGFVGRHLIQYLASNKTDCHILSIERNPINQSNSKNCTYRQLDLNNRDALNKLMAEYKPDYIIHLAAISSVGKSWQKPAETFKNNTGIFLNLLEAVRLNHPKVKILSVGSSEVYGTWPENEMPLAENHELRPDNPYGIARLAQENLARLYVNNFGLDIIQTRSFNHIGPGQSTDFVIPSFIKQLVYIANHKQEPVIQVGNIEIIRDFLDVRDVINAYDILLEKGQTGEIYNVCSGQGIKLKTIIEQVASILNIKPDIIVNQKYLRKNDIPIMVGNNEKISILKWSKNIFLSETLRDIIHHTREENV